MRKGVVLGLAFGLGLGVLIGYLLWGWWARPAVLPEKQGYDILRDLITLVLTIGTVAIAIAGYLIYEIILEKTKAAAQSVAQGEAHRVSAGVLVHVGVS